MKKNKKLLIVVSILLVSIGVSFAYFLTRIVLNGTGAKVEGITATIEGSTLNVVGNISFNDLNILPGHKNISSIKVTATGNNELVPYNLIWRGNNNLNTQLKYTVYKTSSNISVTTSCEKKEELENGKLLYKEECTISNIEELGNKISEGTISNTDTKVILTNDEFITSTETGEVVYYYVILEYPNLEENQNTDINGTFNGQVTVEASNVTPDLSILGVYIKASDGSYVKADSIPESGYNLNNTKSTCSNGATISYDNGLTINNLTTSGVSCTLYFDELTATNFLISKNEMVEENGYRYEGANPNNYVTFNNELWRIIGVFDVENSDTKQTESLVKIIRDQSLGIIAWDTEGDEGINDWTTSDIKTILNGQYYNGEDINYTYKNPSNGYISSNPALLIIGKSITDTARAMIQSVKWTLGGTSLNQITTEAMYTAEKGTSVYSGSPTKWNGYVGLMYASDYGYAVDKSSCPRTTTLDKYNSTTCQTYNWLFKNEYMWTLVPNSSYRSQIIIMGSNGRQYSFDSAYYGSNVYPTIYLKPTIVITGGDGTQSNPYKIS